MWHVVSRQTVGEFATNRFRHGILSESSDVHSVSNANFGPLIAYLVPGATVLAGFSHFSPLLQGWFARGTATTPTIGGFLYLTVASIAVGMTVSAVRWALLDTLHAHTKLPMPQLDFSRLGYNVEAYSLLIDIHYRHYLFYGNMCVATAVAYACYRMHSGSAWPLGWPDVAFAFLEVVFFLTSRDTLRRYFTRSKQLLGASDCSARTPAASESGHTPSPRSSARCEFPFQAIDEVHETDPQSVADRSQLD